MPRKFSNASSILSIQQELFLHQVGGFPAIPEQCVSCPSRKGIYFWYILPEGLDILSRFLPVSLVPTVSPISFDGRVLVYLGTAGTRLTPNNQGHLRQRLEWHITTRHSVSTIRNGTLSTLRTTLASLLSDDLIGANGVETERALNHFMATYMQFTYIEYSGGIDDVIDDINADEKHLIESVRPLFNLKHNLNARVNGHPTNAVRTRRQLINFRTKERIKACAL